MAISGYAVYMQWQDGALAIGETYFWNNSSDDAVAVVYPAAVALMKARTLLMGFGIIPVRFRISKVGSFRYYVNSKPADISAMATGPLLVATNLPPAQVTAGISNQQDGSPDQAKSCILLDAFNTPQSHCRKFFAGVPDVLIRQDPQGPWTIGVPSWGVLFTAFCNLIGAATTKWAFKGKVLPAAAPYIPVAVTSVVQDPVTGFIGVTCPTFIAPVAVGQMLQLRGFTMTSKAYVPPNGTWQINNIVAGTAPGTSVYYLRGTGAVAFTQILLNGTAQAVASTLYPYIAANMTITKQTTHKRGNRSLASPGRRKVVQRVSA